MANVSHGISKVFGPVDATDANGLSTSATIGSATTLTLNGTLIASGSYTSGDNIGQIITITSAADDTGVTFTIVGTDAVGDAQTEIVTGADSTRADSVGYFNTVASITTSGATTGNVEAGVLGSSTAGET